MEAALPTTGQVAVRLGTSEVRINQLVRHGKIVPPPKLGPWRRWTPEKIEELRLVLARNR